MATSDKYDRQLRLWGAKGQRALGNTTCILLRASAVGTETLKNLVLPGIGKIIVVDDDDDSSVCTNSDGVGNFFTPPPSTTTVDDDDQQEGGTSSDDCRVRPPRAQVALEYLRELNPDVNGDWKQVTSIADEWTTSIPLGSPSSSTTTSNNVLVIAADLEPPLLRNVATYCHSQQIPLVVVHAYGLIGSVRLQTPSLPLMEPKAENTPHDLRLVHPFAQLEQFAQSINWDALDNVQHGHVPYPLILWKVADEWKQSHGGNQLPTSLQDKVDFRQAIRNKSRNWDNELNFQEAWQNAYLAYTERQVDMDHVTSLKRQCKSSCPKLYVLLSALEKFVTIHNGRAPLHGSIPDMTASTQLYVQLQKLYHDQALQDVEDFKDLLLAASKDLDDEQQQHLDKNNNIDDEDVHTFCRNVFSLDLLQTRTLEDEYNVVVTNHDDDVVDEWNMVLMDPYEVPEQTPFLWYIALRACRVFYDKYNRYPGTIDKYLQDVDPLQECIVQVVHDMKLQDNDLIQQTLLDSSNKKYAVEMSRQANAEVHNIASVLGGVASQEAVKIITGQYVPFNNTYIYNGIASTGGVYVV